MARPKEKQSTVEMLIESLAEEKKEILEAEKPAETVNLNEIQARNDFKIYWLQNKKFYKGAKGDLEEILWQHLKATNNAQPDNFENGIKHFGYKKE